MTHYIVSEDLDVENEHVVARFHSFIEANEFARKEIKILGTEEMWYYYPTPHKQVKATKVHPIYPNEKEASLCGYTIYEVG